MLWFIWLISLFLIRKCWAKKEEKELKAAGFVCQHRMVEFVRELCALSLHRWSLLFMIVSAKIVLRESDDTLVLVRWRKFSLFACFRDWKLHFFYNFSWKSTFFLTFPASKNLKKTLKIFKSFFHFQLRIVIPSTKTVKSSFSNISQSFFLSFQEALHHLLKTFSIFDHSILHLINWIFLFRDDELAQTCDVGHKTRAHVLSFLFDLRR